MNGGVVMTFDESIEDGMLLMFVYQHLHTFHAPSRGHHFHNFQHSIPSLQDSKHPDCSIKARVTRTMT
jgi:hypothetical protein